MSDTETLKVFVVVDVQNCFVSNISGMGNGLNMGGDNDEIKLLNAYKLVTEIDKISKTSDLVVFTRDMHPENHISFEHDEGRPDANFGSLWPIHCRDRNKVCNFREGSNKKLESSNYKDSKTVGEILEIIKNININDEKIKKDIESRSSKISQEILNTDVIGNELSFYYYFTDLMNIINELNDKKDSDVIALKKGSSPVKGDFYENPIEKKGDSNDIENVMNIDIKPVENKYYSLWKGQRCSQESYSAFNYHIDYIDDAKNPKLNTEFNSIQQRNSTGLFEFILSKLEGKQKIEITLCGLVGDVCVMYSYLEGKELWGNVYSAKAPGVTCEFKINLDATFFLGPGAKNNFPGGFGDKSQIDKYAEKYNTEKSTIPIDVIKSVFVKSPEIEFPEIERGNTHIGGRNCRCYNCMKHITRKYKKTNSKRTKRKYHRKHKRNSNKRK